MNIKSLLLLQLLLVGFISNTIAQTDVSFKISVSVAPQMKQQFLKEMGTKKFKILKY